MGDYTCRLVSSWIMFCVAFSVLIVAVVDRGWFASGDFNIRGISRDGSSLTLLDSDFSRAMTGTILTAIGLSGLCCLLSFIMMCADICCQVTQCMTVIPKITMTMATLAGILAEVCAALFLINVYAVREFPVTRLFGFDLMPGYCFYMTAAAGIWLLIAGCTNFGARHATRVGAANQPTVTEISVVGQHSQSAGGINPYGQPQAFQMGGYFPPPTAVGEQVPGYPRPPTSMGYIPPPTAYYGPRLVVTNTSTQTSLVDIKNVVKIEEASKIVKK